MRALTCTSNSGYLVLVWVQGLGTPNAMTNTKHRHVFVFSLTCHSAREHRSNLEMTLRRHCWHFSMGHHQIMEWVWVKQSIRRLFGVISKLDRPIYPYCMADPFCIRQHRHMLFYYKATRIIDWSRKDDFLTWCKKINFNVALYAQRVCVNFYGI